MNIKYLFNDFPFLEPGFNYFPCREVVLHFSQASNIEVLNIVSLIVLQILGIKCDFLASILPAALL